MPIVAVRNNHMCINLTVKWALAAACHLWFSELNLMSVTACLCGRSSLEIFGKGCRLYLVARHAEHWAHSCVAASFCYKRLKVREVWQWYFPQSFPLEQQSTTISIGRGDELLTKTARCCQQAMKVNIYAFTL